MLKIRYYTRKYYPHLYMEIQLVVVATRGALTVVPQRTFCSRIDRNSLSELKLFGDNSWSLLRLRTLDANKTADAWVDIM